MLLEGKKPLITHNINIQTTPDSASLCFFESPHTFTKPLIDVNFTGMKINAMSLLSPSGFVPTEKEANETNQISFQSVFSVIHLNTRHDFTEMLIEPYPCFGHVSYKYLNEMDDENMDEPESKNSIYLCSQNLPHPCLQFLSVFYIRNFCLGAN